MWTNTQQKCCYFVLNRSSVRVDISVKKLCFRTTEMRISNSVSMLSRAKIRYIFVRSQHNCCANHTTLCPWRSNSARIDCPIETRFISHSVG